jgi:cell division protein FtsW (lipid II flippase)
VSHYLFPPKDRNGIGIIALILSAATAIFFFAQPLLGPLFLLALAIACVVSIVRSGLSQPKWLVPIACAVMLANTLFIRRAPWLDEAVAWHAYHLVIALALAALAKGLIFTEQRVA